MKTIQIISTLSSILVAGALVTGCASDSGQAKAESGAAEAKAKQKSKYNPVANPPKVKFGGFKRVEQKPMVLAEKHRDHKGNQESAARMDEMLTQQLRLMFTEVKVLPKDGEFTKPAEGTLQIAPEIKEIRLITGGTRFWLGPMAGGSDMLVQVIYRDGQSGEIIADPQFAAGNNAWSGSWSMGATDNQMRDSVVREIMGYMAAHK
jgi:hypothetical protein